MANVKVIIDGARIETLLRSPAGAVGRFMLSRAAVVRLAAINDCPKRTGYLSQTIVTRYEEGNEKGFTVRVVALAPYAAAVHEGAEPHDIPNAFGFGPDFGIGGRFDGKFHPGNAANPFLSKNLRLFGAI
jgi:hypothetical protein